MKIKVNGITVEVDRKTVIAIEEAGDEVRFTASLLFRFVKTPEAKPKKREHTLDGGLIVKDDGKNREIVYGGDGEGNIR